MIFSGLFKDMSIKDSDRRLFSCKVLECLEIESSNLGSQNECKNRYYCCQNNGSKNFTVILQYEKARNFSYLEGEETQYS
jgi:hypothetical protein